MMIANLIFALLFQTPAPVPPPDLAITPGQKVLVGFVDGKQLAIESPEFTGFIEGRNGDALLMYRQQNFHGEMPTKTIARIEFRPYQPGKPFPLTITLRNGQKLEVESERRDFVTLRGQTAFGTVTIKNPDPTSVPVKITTRKENRKKDLTIQYLEFPAS
jgi:hypothetical protein